MASEYPVPTTDEMDALFDRLSNWGRWGDDDEQGTLHFLTDERRAAAARSVRTGESISLAHDLATEPLPEHPHPVQHHMLASGDARDANGIPGYEAAREIRRREGSGRRAAIVAMTAEAMAGSRENCLAAGMDDYIAKPVKPSDLLGKLERWAPHEQEFHLPGQPAPPAPSR